MEITDASDKTLEHIFVRFTDKVFPKKLIKRLKNEKFHVLTQREPVCVNLALRNLISRLNF